MCPSSLLSFTHPARGLECPNRLSRAASPGRGEVEGRHAWCDRPGTGLPPQGVGSPRPRLQGAPGPFCLRRAFLYHETVPAPSSSRVRITCSCRLQSSHLVCKTAAPRLSGGRRFTTAEPKPSPREVGPRGTPPRDTTKGVFPSQNYGHLECFSTEPSWGAIAVPTPAFPCWHWARNPSAARTVGNGLSPERKGLLTLPHGDSRSYFRFLLPFPVLCPFAVRLLTFFAWAHGSPLGAQDAKPRRPAPCRPFLPI